MIAEVKAVAALLCIVIATVIANYTIPDSAPSILFGSTVAVVVSRFIASGGSVSSRLLAKSHKGEVVIVTGCNSGIGYVTAMRLARQGFTVVITTRSAQLSKETAARMRAEIGSTPVVDIRDDFFLTLDDFQSVAAFARSFIANGLTLHVLVNNAGMLKNGMRYSEFGDGSRELHTAVNVLGQVLLTELLVPLLKQSNGRVINVASAAHAMVKGHDLNKLPDELALLNSLEGKQNPLKDSPLFADSTAGSFFRYAVTKLLNMYHASYVQDTHGIVCCSLHPGTVATSFINGTVPWPLAATAINCLLLLSMMKTSYEGSHTTVHCALLELDELKAAAQQQSKTMNGGAPYFADAHLEQPEAFAADRDIERRVMKWAVAAVKPWM